MAEYILYCIGGSLSIKDGADYVLATSKSDALSHFIEDLGDEYLETEEDSKITIDISEVDIRISKKALEAIAKERRR